MARDGTLGASSEPRFVEMRILCVDHWLQDEKGGWRMDPWFSWERNHPLWASRRVQLLPFLSHTARPASEQHPSIHLGLCPRIITDKAGLRHRESALVSSVSPSCSVGIVLFAMSHCGVALHHGPVGEWT